MPDTVRTLAALQLLLADNVAGDISAQDVRDMLVSAWVPGHIQYLNHRMPDETAHASDDFFDDASVDAAWTELTVSGGQTITEKYGLLSVDITTLTTVGDVNALLRAVSPSLGDTIETRVHWGTDNAGTGTVLGGLVWSDGNTATDNATTLMAYKTESLGDGVTQVISRGGTFTETGATQDVAAIVNHPVDALYWRLEYDASNSFIASVSFDGVSWQVLGTISDVNTPTHVGLIWGTRGDSLTHRSVTFDYVRYNAA